MWNSWKDFRQLVVIELASFWLGFGNSSLGVSLSLSFSTLDCTFRFAVVNALVILRELFKLFGVSIGLGFSSGGFWNELSIDFPPFILNEDQVFIISNRWEGWEVVEFPPKYWRKSLPSLCCLRLAFPQDPHSWTPYKEGSSRLRPFTSGNKVAAVSSAEASLVRGTNSCNRSCFAWGRVFCILSLTTTTTTATIVRVRVFRSCC